MKPGNMVGIQVLDFLLPCGARRVQHPVNYCNLLENKVLIWVELKFCASKTRKCVDFDSESPKGHFKNIENYLEIHRKTCRNYVIFVAPKK